MKKSKKEWRIHTPNLLKEIAANSQDAQAVVIPLRILGDYLHKVATRASQLNDDELNKLMCQMTLYEIADPASESFDPDLTNKIIDYL